MASPQPSTSLTGDDRSNILAAIAQRSAHSPPQSAEVSAGSSTAVIYSDFDKDHNKRQEFRRLINPGITRPNSREVALTALKTLLQLAENILQHLDEPKYQRFKKENSTIKARIVDPKGTLEYAVALGFRPKVEKFQTFYVWHKQYLNDLRIGSAVLKEVMERENIKEEQLEQARLEEKAVAEAQIEKVKQAFLDDRKSRMLVDERERQRRAAKASSPPPEAETSPPPYSSGSLSLSNHGHEVAPGGIDMDDDDSMEM